MLFDSLPSFIFIFFFNDTATTEIYTLSLHDALPIYSAHGECADPGVTRRQNRPHQVVPGGDGKRKSVRRTRSEEHTSELQSPCNLVCRLLLEKKKQTIL